MQYQLKLVDKTSYQVLIERGKIKNVTVPFQIRIDRDVLSRSELFLYA